MKPGITCTDTPAINQAGCRAEEYLCETEQKKIPVPITENNWNIKEIFSISFL